MNNKKVIVTSAKKINHYTVDSFAKFESGHNWDSNSCSLITEPELQKRAILVKDKFL